MTKMYSSIFLIFNLLLPLIQCEDYIEATADNFDSLINEHDVSLVKFYAEWCGHCQRMAPEFAKAATILKKATHPVTLIKVNCPNHQKVCDRFGVSGYPTLKVFHKGDFKNPEDYEGERDADGIVSFMRTKAGPDSQEVKTQTEIDEIVQQAFDPVFVLYIDSKHEQMFDFYLRVAKDFRGRFTFLHVFLPSKYMIRRYLPKYLQTKLEPVYEELTAKLNHEKLRDWVNEHWGGVLPFAREEPMKMDRHDLFYGNKQAIVTVNFDADYERDPKGSHYLRNRLIKSIKQLQAEHQLHCRFAMSSLAPGAQSISQYISKSFGKYWKKGDAPVVTAWFKNKRFIMDREWSLEEFKKWVLEFDQGRIEPFIKSEPVPSSQPEAVVKVVAKTFDEVVRDSGKNVLIEFYAPWCGHCKQLKPIYEQLAKKVQDKSDLVIAAMDATENDIPFDFGVKGYPTIYWMNKRNEIMAYNGERTLEGFLKFIETHTEHKFERDEL